jgi:DNA-binding CsgD family transcriptional regulator
MSDYERPRLSLLLGVAFLAVVAGGITDLALDRPARWLSPHVIFEVSLVALSLGLALYLWTSWYRAARSLGAATRALAQRQADADHWRASAERLLDGLGRAIDGQFETWGLTATEREVALWLLKGYGHKQIAARTGRSERTVRQHAVTVYRKSGLGGRSELAAFFLNDVILPDAPESRSHPAAGAAVPSPPQR